ncbi:hypothetical protein JDS67_22505 [Bacillus cereus]|uniref:hypothetical protein n=1 Tax=Bacillus cereus TaxID=1396 RepID=UPI0018F36947|nr:hypothetical protein [Bacillus cereus]MBJ8127170.1 hypothetical protein [Bacillus cereus]
MRFIETVHIKWYGMYSINDFYNREEASKKGIFAISRVYAKNVKEIKSLLILRHTPLENETSLLYYRGKFNLKIINKGRRGLIVKKLSTGDLMWT